MARKNYSEEFRRQAVDLFESTPGATLKGVAADLGVVRGTLRHWVDLYGTVKKTGPDSTSSPDPSAATRAARGRRRGRRHRSR
jgi:transposase